MKNVPRIFVDEKLQVGKQYPISTDLLHYLTRVMRTDECLVFNNGVEYNAKLVTGHWLLVTDQTSHTDPSSGIILAFAPIKKTDDLINMATQMGVAKFQPVITDRTVAHHINWDRMRKIATEAAEQSNRNSVPEILPPAKFSDHLSVTSDQLFFADERNAYTDIVKNNCTLHFEHCTLLIGPEGGFSDAEFAALDAAGAIGISLGKTILRAEVAAIAALAKILN